MHPVVKHLYVHVPFCVRRCAYCDFNTYANLEDRIESYVTALCAELALLAMEQPQPTNVSPLTGINDDNLPPTAGVSRATLQPSIFFGGGTPSLLTLAQLERVLHVADTLVPLDTAEITLEANPGALLGANMAALDYLRGLREVGINRLSLGVQSLHDPTLRVLGRTHTAAEAYRCFAAARQAGFASINLDFMFGLPGQTVAQWEAALAEVLTWGADHFALYALILEEHTPLAAQVMRGQVCVPDDDATATMYEAAMQHLATAGYAQYEISNWARSVVQQSTSSNRHERSHPDDLDSSLPALACQHNLAYWLNSDYLAAGAGAHGHVYPQRYANLVAVDAYIAAVQAGCRPVAEWVPLTVDDLYAETMFMGLRLNAGVSLAHFRDRCGADLDAVYGNLLHELAQTGLIERGPWSVRLTERGRMVGNQVFARFV